MSNGMTTGGTPIELYNDRRRTKRDAEESLEQLSAVMQYDLAVSESAMLHGSVRLDHGETFHRFNDWLDEYGLRAYAVLSQDKHLAGGERQPAVTVLLKQD